MNSKSLLFPKVVKQDYGDQTVVLYVRMDASTARRRQESALHATTECGVPTVPTPAQALVNGAPARRERDTAIHVTLETMVTSATRNVPVTVINATKPLGNAICAKLENLEKNAIRNAP